MSNIRQATHPGLYIKEALDDMMVDEEFFANKTGISSIRVSKIISGEVTINEDDATKIGQFFGNSKEGWMNLQKKYNNYIQNSKRNEL